jgi:hypothetical protein
MTPAILLVVKLRTMRTSRHNRVKARMRLAIDPLEKGQWSQRIPSGGE